MSEYGKLYEEVSRIRANLKEISRATMSFGELRATPLIETNRLADAKASVAILKSALDALLKKWEELEKEMEKADDR